MIDLEKLYAWQQEKSHLRSVTIEMKLWSNNWRIFIFDADVGGMDILSTDEIDKLVERKEAQERAKYLQLREKYEGTVKTVNKEGPANE